ncbi:MAG: hypothetical protein P8Z30_12785, partial [Acidobacteriota bacterium]
SGARPRFDRTLCALNAPTPGSGTLSVRSVWKPFRDRFAGTPDTRDVLCAGHNLESRTATASPSPL